MKHPFGRLGNYYEEAAQIDARLHRLLPQALVSDWCCPLALQGRTDRRRDPLRILVHVERRSVVRGAFQSPC